MTYKMPHEKFTRWGYTAWIDANTDNTGETRFKERLWTIEITLPYWVSHYIKDKTQCNTQNWD